LPGPLDDRGEIRKAFANVAHTLIHRIRIFTSLPMAKLDRLALQARMRDIGRAEG